MIDNFLGIDTGVGVMILFFFKRQVKSPVLHNTRDGSEFYVPYLCTICNFRGRTSALVRVGGGKGGIPGRLHTSIMKPA